MPQIVGVEPRRDLFDSNSKIALGLSGAVEALKFVKSHCREIRPRTGKGATNLWEHERPYAVKHLTD